MVSKICATLTDHDCGIYVEDYFGELLRVERKRSERSKDHFLLMLLDISIFQESDNKKGITEQITSILCASIRDVDAVGWYKYDTVIGLMFREMKEGGCSSSAKDIIIRRIYDKLLNFFDREFIKKILVSCHSFPESNEIILANTPLDLNLYPDLLLSTKTPLSVFSFFIKSLMDVFGSLVGIIIFSPLFMGIALLVKYSSPGPVFFRQERVGLFGKIFTFLKFRTMYVNEDLEIHKQFVTKFISGQEGDNSGAEETERERIYKIKDDPRVTRIGRFLRKTPSIA
jgi:hypothetical protein